MRRLIWLALCLSLLPVPARAAPDTKYVALTFDDGPSGKYTRRLLEGLWERDAHATFFLCGYRMEQYPDLVLQILEEGHEIGCHGATHSSMVNMSRREICEEIDSLEDPRFSEVLEMFFIDCMEFDDIAEELGYSERHVISLYSEAIEILSLKDQ